MPLKKVDPNNASAAAILRANALRAVKAAKEGTKDEETKNLTEALDALEALEDEAQEATRVLGIRAAQEEAIAVSEEETMLITQEAIVADPRQIEAMETYKTWEAAEVKAVTEAIRARKVATAAQAKVQEIASGAIEEDSSEALERAIAEARAAGGEYDLAETLELDAHWKCGNAMDVAEAEAKAAHMAAKVAEEEAAKASKIVKAMKMMSDNAKSMAAMALYHAGGPVVEKKRIPETSILQDQQDALILLYRNQSNHNNTLELCIERFTERLTGEAPEEAPIPEEVTYPQCMHMAIVQMQREETRTARLLEKLQSIV